MDQKVILQNEDFKIKIVNLGELKLQDIEKGFVFVVQQDKLEVCVEPDSTRKKVICKIYSKTGNTETFEFTLPQFCAMLKSNTTKKALKSDEEKIIEDAARAKAEREGTKGTGSSKADIEDIGRDIPKKQKSKSGKSKPAGKAKRVVRKRT